MANYSVNDIANWFLTKDEMSPKKVQKLVYYAYSWFLTLNNNSGSSIDNKLFEEEPQAWVHGPVFPDLYHDYKEYGYSNIPKSNPDVLPNFEEEVISVLDEVFEVYGKFTANELESITHQESPWINARKGYNPIQNCREVIKDADIFDCYISRVS